MHYSSTYHIIYPSVFFSMFITLIFSCHQASSFVIKNIIYNSWLFLRAVLSQEVLSCPSDYLTNLSIFFIIIPIQLFINFVYTYISIHNTSLANYIFYDNFYDALQYFIDAHSPLIISTKKYGAHSPLFNNDLVLLRRRLRYHQLKFKISTFFTHLESFKNIRSMYKTKLSAEKSSFYTDELNKYGISSKEYF